MDRALLHVALVSALSLGLGCGAMPDEQAPPVQQAEEPILGGTLDTTHTAVAALLQVTPDGQPLSSCSSTTIATKGRSGILLTAAHCAVEFNGDEPTTTPSAPESLVVIPGNDWATSPNIFRAVQVSVHPNYDASVDSPYDIAVVRYAGALASTPTIPILTAAADDITLGSDVTLVGYGRTESDDMNTRRFTVDQQVVDLNAANLLYDQTNGRGVCLGDSGGPALYTTASGERVAGVSSYVAGACEAGISVRVSAYASFIDNVIASAPTTLDCDECSVAAAAPGNPCEDANLACNAGTVCGDFLDCADPCTSDACIDACASNFPAGAQDYQDLIACVCEDGCATECASNPTCGGGATCGGLSSPKPTCTLCMQQSCCDQAAACAGDPACEACITSGAKTCSSPAFGALQVCRANCAGDPCDVTMPASGGAGGSGGAAASGAGGTSAGSGGSSSGGSDAGAAGTSMPVYGSGDSSGCGCRLAPSRSNERSSALAFAGLAAIAFFRTRRRLSFR